MQTLIPDANSFTPPPRTDPDIDRGRVQEGVAIGLAIVVLIATFVVAGLSVAEGTVPPASRTEGSETTISPSGVSGQCPNRESIVVISDGVSVRDRVCPFGS